MHGIRWRGDRAYTGLSWQRAKVIKRVVRHGCSWKDYIANPSPTTAACTTADIDRIWCIWYEDSYYVSMVDTCHRDFRPPILVYKHCYHFSLIWIIPHILIRHHSSSFLFNGAKAYNSNSPFIATTSMARPTAAICQIPKS